MLALGLSAADYRQYMETLATSHEVKITVQVLTPGHQPEANISHLLLGGQVDCVTSPLSDPLNVAVSRTCTLRLLDPKRSLTFTADSPIEGAVYFDRMLRIYYSVYTGRADNGGWVDVPVFTGPISKLTREGDVAVVEGQGKEAYGMGESYTGVTIQAKHEKVDAVRSLLIRTGELASYMNIPASSERLPKDLIVLADQKLWPAAFATASSITWGNQGWTLFYDARGQAQVRPIFANPVMAMATGPGSFITSDIKINYSLTDLRNAVRVIGRKTAGSDATVTAYAVAPATHPLSPQKLGRNGQRRYYMETIDRQEIVGLAAAQALADTTLTRLLGQKTEATWECLPVPHLEPWDHVLLSTDKFIQPVPVSSFTLPLTVDQPMLIGALRAARAPRRK